MHRAHAPLHLREAPALERRHRALTGALLALVSAGLTLAALEGGIRLLYRRRASRAAVLRGEPFYYHDLDGRKRHIPGRTGRRPRWDGDGMVEVRVNSLGFLDGELADPKPAGERRVLFLGDSIVEGAGFPREETFVELAGARLAARGLRAEAVNAAVGDAGLAETLDTLSGPGLRARPDAVVLGVFLNDSRPPQGFRDENFHESPYVRALKSSGLLRRSYLANFVAFRLLQHSVSEAVREPFLSKRFAWVEEYRTGAWREDAAAARKLVALARWDWGAAWSPAELERLALLIEEHRRLCEREGIPFAVLLLPAEVQVASRAAWPERYAPQRALASILSESGVPVLDLAPALEKADVEGVFLDHCHLGPAGHAAAAEALEPFLVQLLEPR